MASTATEAVRRALTTTTSLLRMRVEGCAPFGALHLSKVLPADQMKVLESLPLVCADRDSAIALHLECVRASWPCDPPRSRRCTVRIHLSAAIGKTGATTRAEAARLAQANGWL